MEGVLYVVEINVKWYQTRPSDGMTDYQSPGIVSVPVLCNPNTGEELNY